MLVAKVDCTVEKKVCAKYGVTGYPTIKTFTPEKEGGKHCQISIKNLSSNHPGDYNGGRSLEELKSYVDENLAIKCSVAEQELCSEKELKYIAKFQAKGDAAVQDEIVRLSGMQGASMKPDLKKWLSQRLNLLKGM